MAMVLSAARAKSKQAALKILSANDVEIFKIRNRKGFAAICLGNLCEGKSPEEAFARLLHPLRRMGYALPERPPRSS